MVTMATESPLVTVNRGRMRGRGELVRTPAAIPPVRLTRRGRMVVTGVTALLIGALSVGFATMAQATRTGSASPGRYLTKVTVLPGQTLWSIAEANDPNADTRLIIQRIQQLNSMSGDELSPGEALWVPRG